jgi:hypothetical protein
MKVTSWILPIDRKRGYPRQHARQFPCANEPSVSTANFITYKRMSFCCLGKHGYSLSEQRLRLSILSAAFLLFSANRSAARHGSASSFAVPVKYGVPTNELHLVTRVLGLQFPFRLEAILQIPTIDSAALKV